MGYVNGQWVPDPAPPFAPPRRTFQEAFGRLAGVLTVRPMAGAWPGSLNRDPRRAPFRASWGNTCGLLADELRILGADQAVLQLAITEGDLRRDGMVRASALPTHAGVILSFTHPAAGPLLYPCDQYVDWQDNVRAIALSLQALRAVDRYGVTRRAEQYRGWRALPEKTGTTLTVDQAAQILVAEASSVDVTAARVLAGSSWMNAAYRLAVKRTHPDAGGSAEAFHRVQQAKTLLDAHFGAAGA